ncbi:phospholipase D family protein (plasmid) [Burkholderia sp. MS455]|uniref:phospholipase D family nuclease n=1 Tax=Burkholderia sp. MS455 TaxID=2811788 RepID=UPI001956115A|nr:phospholipase D family protein [Burkholderia sp. MS455]QRR11809.1 phospholipase D family protein [Burkholderia sp. MS455]
MKSAIWIGAAAALLSSGMPESALGFSLELPSNVSRLFESAASSTTAPGGSCVPEVGFSPEGSGAALVLKTIASAKRTIRVSAYAFTSRDVARALVQAKARGVDVAVAVDARQNLTGTSRGASAAALSMLLHAGIPVRTIGSFAIHHDKTVTVDAETVQTGSFNFSAAAARKNSEDVLVLWNCPAIAQAYNAHWQSRWVQGTPYRQRGES